MKSKITLFSMALLLGLTTVLQAQQTSIDRYFDTYQTDDRFTSVTISARMFGLFAELDPDEPDQQELLDAISNITGLKMLIGEDMDLTEAQQVYADAVKKPATQMEELMKVSETEREFTFYITETDGHISELLMIGHTDGNLMMMSLVGDIDLRKLTAISRNMNIDGLEHLDNIGQ
ncbi:MAG: DUF4252 domain-containing protein [Bacteroidota bacterium]